MKCAIKQLLDDEDFIRWCLFPESDSETFRNRHGKKGTPCEKEDITEARRIVRSLELNDYTLSDEQSERLHIVPTVGYIAELPLFWKTAQKSVSIQVRQ